MKHNEINKCSEQLAQTHSKVYEEYKEQEIDLYPFWIAVHKNVKKKYLEPLSNRSRKANFWRVKLSLFSYPSVSTYVSLRYKENNFQ